MDKRQWLVISFSGTHEAMRAEQLFQEHGVEGLLIPTPRSISASCGLCWRTPPSFREQVKALVEQAGLRVEQYHDIWM